MRSRRRKQSRANAALGAFPHDARVRRGEEGFSLIELLIVIVILPLVVGGMAAALIAVLQNETRTFNSVSNSVDAQITSANFVRDVQSASAVSLGNPFGGDCGSFPSSTLPMNVIPANSEELLTLRWGQYTARTVNDGVIAKNSSTLTSASANFTEADVGSLLADTNGYIPVGTKIAAYVSPTAVTMSAPANFSTNADSVTISTYQTVVSYFDWPVVTPTATTYELVRRFCWQTSGLTFQGSQALAHNLPAPVVLPSNPDGQGPATVTCTTPCPTLSSAWVPTSQISNVALSDNESLSAYQFNLSAAPRSSDLSTSSSALPTMLITGSGQALSLPNALDVLNVTGVDGELAFGSSGGSLAAGVAGAQVNAADGIVENQCSTTSCATVTSSFAGSCNGSVPCPSASSVSVPTLSGVPVPSTPTSSSGPLITGCVTGSPTTCAPGYYPNPVVVSGTVNFASGNFLFAGGVTIQSGSTVTFGSGQYTFDQGLNVGAGSTMTGNAVFFYFGSNTSSLSVGSNVNVSLTAPTSGAYMNILIYQPSLNTQPMSIDASGAATNLYGGAIEAPSAALTLGTAGATLHITQLVASSVTLGSSVTVTVGP
jgi:type II secretory pathway pseudopilin PulG